MGELSDRLIAELVDAVRAQLRKEQSDRLRDVYLIGDIEKDTARACIERLRELANDNNRPITLYINSAGGNVTDGLAIHDAIRHIVSRGIEVTIIVQGMAYSMGSIVLQAASEGPPARRFPHSWIMIHEPAKWAGWQSTTAAAQHLERLKQMQDQIYRILSSRSGKPLRQIIKDTKRNDFYLDAQKALEYGLIDAVVAGELPAPKPAGGDARKAWRQPSRTNAVAAEPVELPAARETSEVAAERSDGGRRLTVRRPCLFPARHSSSSRAALPATECSVGVQPTLRARAAHDLIERQRVGERPIFVRASSIGTCRTSGRTGTVRRDRGHDVVDALVAFVVGVIHADASSFAASRAYRSARSRS